VSEFKNVSVVKNANVYFDGKVTSRKIIFNDGSVKTLGIMAAGEYEFATVEKEVMEILAGEVSVKLPTQNNWQEFTAGDSFEVPANASFTIKAKTLTDYCCSYLS